MQLRAQPDGLGEPIKINGLRSIVVMDDYGQPLMVAQKLDDGVTVIYRNTDAGFTKVLDAFGIGLHAKYVKGKMS